MAILKTFLCICNTRTGSLVSGCYTLAISLLCLVYFLFRYVGHKLVENSTEYKGIIYVGFVLYGFMIVSSLVIIPGVQLDKRYLLLPWIYIVILVVLYDTGSVALLTTVHMEREKTLHVWEIIWLFFYLFRLAANCYCFTCVVSQYQELSDGRGTYDFLYKPRRRARLRNLSQFDIDTFDLPFGVHLPPYTAEDNSEHSPPTYSQIYPKEQENSSSSSNCEQICEDSENSLHSRNRVINVYDIRQTGQDNQQSCTVNCQYCASARQNSANRHGSVNRQSSANYSYLGCEINPLLTSRPVELPTYTSNSTHTSATPALGADSIQNQSPNQTICPVSVHSEDINLQRPLQHSPCTADGGNRRICNHGNRLNDNSNTSLAARRFQNRHQCYEVTVNVEWI